MSSELALEFWSRTPIVYYPLGGIWGKHPVLTINTKGLTMFALSSSRNAISFLNFYVQ